MKNIIKILCTIFAVGLLLIIVSGIIYMINPNVINELSGGQYEVKEITDTEEFNSLNIAFYSGKVELYDASDNSFHVEYPENKHTTYSYNNENGVCTLKETRKKGTLPFDLGNNKPTTKIYIPKKNYESFTLKQASGSTYSYLTTLCANNITITNTSGMVTISNFTSLDTLSLNCTSGNTNFSNILSNNIDIKMNSGEINGNKIDWSEFSCDIDSGSATYTDLSANKINSSCKSGLTSYKLTGSIDDYSYNLKATSGDIKLGDTITIKKDLYQTSDKEKNFYGRVTSGKLVIVF